MKIQIDINEKIIILLDPVTFSEIESVMQEIKNLIKDDLNQWKIQTDNKKEDMAVPVYPIIYPRPFQPWPVDYPQQPFNPPLYPNPNQTPYVGSPSGVNPIQQPITWCGDTSTNIYSTATCKTSNN